MTGSKQNLCVSARLGLVPHHSSLLSSVKPSAQSGMMQTWFRWLLLKCNFNLACAPELFLASGVVTRGLALPEGLVEAPGSGRVWLSGIHIRAQLHGEGAGLLVAQGAP